MPVWWSRKNSEHAATQTTDTDESRLTTTFHETDGRDMQESSVHMAEPVEVPGKIKSATLADISEVTLKEEEELFEDSISTPASSDLPSTILPAIEMEESPQQPVQVVDRLGKWLMVGPAWSSFI